MLTSDNLHHELLHTLPSPLPIAVFLSGGGRTLANLIEHRDHHDLPIDIRLVVASRSGLGGQQIADDAGIQSFVVRKQNDDAAYCRAMFDPVRACGATHVVMAGFLKHVLIPEDFTGRVINIHPSLLPAFGGQGMYGQKVHQAVIDKGVQVSGCTVHLVDNIYDNGPILLQRACPVQPDDTPETLAARVFQEECLALPDALRHLWKEVSQLDA